MVYNKYLWIYILLRTCTRAYSLSLIHHLLITYSLPLTYMSLLVSQSVFHLLGCFSNPTLPSVSHLLLVLGFLQCVFFSRCPSGVFPGALPPSILFGLIQSSGIRCCLGCVPGLFSGCSSDSAFALVVCLGSGFLVELCAFQIV